jgi:hypothetical protein
MSPETSFTASIVLASIGVLTLKKAKTIPQWLLGVIPLFFAMQQLAEGFIWLYLKGDITSSPIASIAKYTFLSIALPLFPFWVPLALFYNEPNPVKKKALLLFLIFGIAISYFLLRSLLRDEIPMTIANGHIQYGQAIAFYGKLLYLSAILGPLFISSVPYMWILGSLIAVSYLVTEFFYSYAFISVWCFFAGIISLFIYYIISPHFQLNKS